MLIIGRNFQLKLHNRAFVQVIVTSDSPSSQSLDYNPNHLNTAYGGVTLDDEMHKHKTV